MIVMHIQLFNVCNRKIGSQELWYPDILHMTMVFVNTATCTCHTVHYNYEDINLFHQKIGALTIVWSGMQWESTSLQRVYTETQQTRRLPAKQLATGHILLRPPINNLHVKVVARLQITAFGSPASLGLLIKCSHSSYPSWNSHKVTVLSHQERP